MNAPTGRQTLKARYLFPVDSSPLSDATVTVDAGRIVAIGQDAPGGEIVDLGNVAILPGLVNAHTHLEFSHLPTPLGNAQMPFADWIRSVIQHRREQAPSNSSESVQAGLQESRAAGVTTLGEITTGDWPADCFNRQATVFYELLGLSTDRIEPLMQEARQHLTAAKQSNTWHPGLSPHAPYTVHPELLRQVCDLSAESQIPLAMHLAESTEELELLAAHRGPLVDLLTELGAWDPSVIPRGTKPLDYLKQLEQAHRTLVIHGNYLDQQELDFLAEYNNRMSVVYCPRTHAYFGHRAYPLATMLECGINVALGTDSRASNPDLSLLNEMRFVAQHHQVALQSVLHMGTLAGAKALGVDDETGSLTVGKRADLAVLPLPQREASDPYELLFDSDMTVQATF